MPLGLQEPVPKHLVVTSFAGLEVEAAPFTRPINTWQILENFLLTRSGQIRKLRGILTYNDNVYDSPVVVVRSYRRMPVVNRVNVALSKNGTIYDLDSGATLSIGILPPLGFPFVTLFSGIDNLVDTIQYLVIVPQGERPWKFNGTGVSVVGVSTPIDPPVINYLLVRDMADDPFPPVEYKFITLKVSRRYRWTYWNPTTRHESSPSPFVEVTPDQFFLDASKRIVHVHIILPVIPPDYGNGYTKKRLYATTDGGEEFFLVRGLNGMDEDGAFSLILENIHDGDQILTVNGGPVPGEVHPPGGPVGGIPDPPVEVPPMEDLGIGPTTDASLVEPGPTDGENDPPPVATWGAVYQNRLWLLDATDPTRLVFSKIGEFQSFPVENFFLFKGSDFDPLTALHSDFVSLMVGKRGGFARVTGTDFTDFQVVTNFDPQVGVVGKRLMTAMNGASFIFSREGIMQLEAENPTFIGKRIKPITDDVVVDLESRDKGQAAVDSKNGYVLFSLPCTHFVEEGSEEILILVDVSEESPFSIVRGGTLTSQGIFSVQEVPLTDDREVVLLGLGDNKVYQFDISPRTIAERVHTPAAIAQTQYLPHDDMDRRKVFHNLRVQVDNTAKFTYTYAVDGGPFSAPRELRRFNLLGVVGRVIQLQFIHAGGIAGFTSEPPILSNFEIQYVVMEEDH